MFFSKSIIDSNKTILDVLVNGRIFWYYMNTIIVLGVRTSILRSLRHYFETLGSLLTIQTVAKNL